MAYTAARSALQQYTDVSVSCSHCGASATLLSPSDTVRDSLMNATYLNMFQQELDLLHRAQALFSRFPSSRHPLKTGHEWLKRVDKGQPDEAFEGALAKDPELHEFLTNKSFLLSRRLEVIATACTKLSS